MRYGLASLALALLTACGPAARSRDSASTQGDPFVQAFARLKPSVVLLTMNIPSDDPKKKGTWDEAYGSGVVVSSGRWGTQILTVEHVVHDARNLRATLGERKSAKAHVLAKDERADLALLEVTVPNVVPATLGSSRGIAPGTQIGVAGFPIPDAFQDEGLVVKTSVFAGRISSVRNDALELDLPVIPGESGGPIFDAHSGTVIGLAESRFDEEKAIGFGIPIEDAETFLHGRLHDPALAHS